MDPNERERQRRTIQVEQAKVALQFAQDALRHLESRLAALPKPATPAETVDPPDPVTHG